MQSSLRKIWSGCIVAGLILAFFASVAPTLAQSNAARGTLLTLDGPVTPASASYLEREIGAASGRGDALVIVEIDTPGGLVDSMKSIIKAILASETPVVTYVYPQGARSASAGLYIMYAAHVSAMAPATNTGSATPVELGGTGGGESPFPAPERQPEDVTEGDETDATDAPQDGEPQDAAPADQSNEASLRGKIIEDSVAYIRALAEERDRNAEWAEKAVRPPSASITANEALELGVIEIIAEDLDDLLRQLDGRTVTTAAGEVQLSTGNIVMTRVEPTMVERILGFFANPNVAAILLTLGTTGLIVEMWNPGSIFPGALGILSLIMALYAFQVLPYNVLPLALMGVGLVLITVEAFTPSFGLVGTGGLVLFGIGLYFLFPGEFRVAPALLVGTVGSAALILFTVLVAVVRSRGHGPLIGYEAIRKREGRVTEWNQQKGEGYVIVDGERWKARSKEPLAENDRIKVQDVDGIVLIVRRAQANAGMARFIPSRQGR
jgi:membrane-bound serine protease (ClpP class)